MITFGINTTSQLNRVELPIPEKLLQEQKNNKEVLNLSELKSLYCFCDSTSSTKDYELGKVLNKDFSNDIYREGSLCS